MKFVRALGVVLFVLAWLVLLLSSTITWVANDPDFYLAGFKKYGIAARTGIDPADVEKVPQQFVDYFNSGEEYLDIRVTQSGRRVELFNQREIQHMKDVKDLVRFGNLMQWLSLLFVAAFASAGMFWWQGRRRRAVYKLILAGCLSTLVIIFLIGGMALVNFQGFFLVFHLVSFTNELWMLDPARDNLIRMFPEGFFFDSAIFIGGLVALEAALGCGFMVALLRGSKAGKLRGL
ncbi:MAG: TIGR01906 family membrane protein [Chloroflexi bacterium]|nr:TIGR01906 family membrane protein [Chloroflexota bacterium]